MRPSSECGISAVLTTVPELAVVHYAIAHDTGKPEIAERFYEQTRRFVEPQLYTFPCTGFTGETWQQDARFNVLPKDEPFVLGAAAHIVAEHRYRKKIRFAANGTARAAIEMFAHFSTDRQLRFM